MRECLLPILLAVIIASTPGEGDVVSFTTVKTWAHKLGFELSQLGKYVINVQKFEDSYKTAQVIPRDGNALVHEIAKDIKAMMESKMSAIRRIMDIAETVALDDEQLDVNYTYTNAKNVSQELQYSVHFGGDVNTSMSSVHVPTNVYDRAPAVIKAIKWSARLDDTFINNYKHDPTLSWQYFGSATGFMRQFPATIWNPKPVDLFDCRTRGWYIEAANSPKDVLILVDTSGSMTGVRKEIARHVVNNILDTLGNNDFVNIITFSNETREVVPCFNDTLVQANLGNIRELKEAIAELSTERIADFEMVLVYAFQLLARFRNETRGAMCNQAIMLITDGVPYNYKDIFREYNWGGSSDEPDKYDMPVRVFTYLIGREVTDVREVQWMACANRGYYVHLSTFAEVREQVLNYVPVMARPLVLGKHDHPTIWTPVYADITDPKMADWLWEQKECEDQKERVLEFRRNRRLYMSNYQRDRKLMHKPKRHHGLHDEMQEYQLMTSVSMPVYDRRENANITEQVLIKEAYWVSQTRETRIADLLGVAGTDVPIQEIQKLMLPYKLGVNGYAFIVTNNGYILIHPDLRPVFQGILKPSYNAVDMAEVELLELGGPRDFDAMILGFRERVINQENGTVNLNTKYHYDDMRRVGRAKRKYDFTGIDKTPFTVVVSLPLYDNDNYRVHATEELHRAHVNDYFADSNWLVHPDWTYCKYHYKDEHRFETPEKLFLHFLERTRLPGWFWSDKKLPSQPPELSVTNSGGSGSHSSSSSGKDSFYCDRYLFQSLVHDAKVTGWFANINTTREEKGPLARLMNRLPRKEFQHRFELVLAFMATHSGLTRWQDLAQEETMDPLLPDEHFGRIYPRAIDEIWYKRAVEQHYVQPDSFVFSIPPDEIADNLTLVTASRAIFTGGNGKGKAPAAVVGFQFKHTALQSIFQNITFNCEGASNCSHHCNDSSLECYLVDNNAFILASSDESDAGRFFGEVRGPVLMSMVSEGIYEKITIFDYQGVCFMSRQTANDGSILLTPWITLKRTLSWLFAQVVYTWAKFGLWETDYAFAQEYDHDEHLENGDTLPPEGSKPPAFDPRVVINRTKPTPCDQEVDLYLLRNTSSQVYDVSFNSSKGCDRPYVVQPVDFSNMLLVVVYVDCPGTADFKITVIPEEINYPNASLACQKASDSLKRRRPSSCIRSHPRESEIKDRCGRATSVQLNSILFLLIALSTLMAIRY
ncbi:voltage-dependent calcium channel subunit alpha-2/delta-3 isoform X2 [Fopius arisanus]|uniref:Voltage-dependent calcium channel subunit alpha-2/delta-3 isoform X2 n=1 Tax=Fopius arisanus TaxID=64838 RepID=A0A9R1U3N4_9HYME|nr:PREDICTED: voltage-dependent calcium channel subunit alpha-2/delta-3 isoform X2 [Fopius arisanus]